VTLDWCGEEHKFQTLAVIFFIVLMFMHVAFGGGPNASVGNRLAAISTAWLLKACSDATLGYKDFSGYYHSFSSLCLGIGIMIVVDMGLPWPLGDTCASQQARMLMIQAMDLYEATFQDFFDASPGCSTKAEVHKAVEKIEALISEASTKSAEAVTNPSMLEKTWSSHYFGVVAGEFTKLCSLLKNLAEQADEDNDRSMVFDSLTNSKGVVLHELNKDLDAIIRIARLVLLDRYKAHKAADDFFDKLMMENSVSGDGTLTAAIDSMVRNMNQDGLNQSSADTSADTWKFVVRRGVILTTLITISDVLKDSKRKFVEEIKVL
jgi:hypothetical protein